MMMHIWDIVIHVKLREGFKKKKSQTWDIVPTGGGVGPKPKIECPNLLKCFDTKIELNWSVSPK